MKRRREWFLCPIESVERTAARVARCAESERRDRRLALLPDAILSFLFERMVPWAEAYEQAHPFWTDEEMREALDACPANPELWELMKQYPAEVRAFREARSAAGR